MATALIPTNGKTDVRLTEYGAREEIGAMKDRILAMMPGAGKLSKEEIFGLAQIAVAHKLNPFNGEVYAIPGKGLMIGIKGLRKKAHEQVAGNFWIDYREIVDPAERKRYRIEDNALAFEARLYDSENVRTYTDTIKTLTAAGIPWEAVAQMVGTRPYTSGIGVFHANEQSRMEPVQCARKRAESNALKQRFDVPFGVKVEADVEEGEIVDAQTSAGPDYADPAFVAGQIDGEQVKADQEALFGEK